MEHPAVQCDTRFRALFGAFISVPTLSGKSQWIFKLIANIEKMIDIPIQRIVYCYDQWQPGFEIASKTSTIEFVKGLSEILSDDNYFTKDHPTLLVIDDLANEIATDPGSTKLFTQIIHHRNVCIFLLIQNVFKQGRSMRDIALNSQYYVMFRNVRDVGQISVLARQMGIPHLTDAYRSATEEPYQPIVVDLKSDSPEYLRVRSHVFPHEIMRLYLKKSFKISKRDLNFEKKTCIASDLSA